MATLINILGFCITIITVFLTNYLSKRRDLSNKKKEIRIGYLIETWQQLERVANREFGCDTKDLEKVVADIQLFGSPKQVELIQQFAMEFAKNKLADASPLLIELRKDLRAELLLEPVEDVFKFLRVLDK